jgi:hypothetical protein
MGTTAKQFRVFNSNTQTCPFRSDVLKECYEFLKKQNENEYGDFFVDDSVNDIEISAEDIVDAFDSGENPGDLTFF